MFIDKTLKPKRETRFLSIRIRHLSTILKNEKEKSLRITQFNQKEGTPHY
jgi:hypothetical protein